MIFTVRISKPYSYAPDVELSPWGPRDAPLVRADDARRERRSRVERELPEAARASSSAAVVGEGPRRGRRRCSPCPM
jgi:hypothetical protein